MASKVRIEGARELEGVLKKLGPRVAKKVVLGALRSGGNIIRREAKRLVPVESGELRDSIIVASERQRKRTTGNVVIGPRKGVNYGHLVEFGTAPHTITVKDAKSLGESGQFGTVVHHPGAVAHPFLRPAFDAKGDEALNKVGEMLGRGVEREALKLAGPRKGRR